MSTTWSGLTEGLHKVWFEFSAGGDTQARFNKEFTVAGLANLRGTRWRWTHRQPCTPAIPGLVRTGS